MTSARLFATIVALAPMTVSAQPVASTEAKPTEPAQSGQSADPSGKELTAADVAAAPLPGEESGRTDMPVDDSLLRRLARSALFLPKIAIEVGLSPFYAGTYLEDRFNLEDRYYRLFYNEDHTIGLYPTGTYSTGLGAEVGMALLDANLFGHHEHLTLQAMTGEVFGQSYHEGAAAALNSGGWLGRLQVGIGGSLDRRPQDPFYGIGNADLVGTAAGPIDPRTDPLAVSTHYRYQELRATAYADVRLTGPLHARATGALADHEFGDSTDSPSVETIYAPAGLVGFGGFRNLYGELELRADARKRASLFEPPQLHTEGWLADAAIGRVHELDMVGPDFWRGTVELQEYLRIAQGPRLLAFRLRGEAVSGSTSAVPFTELPMLGGGDFLRGYDYERFRDRVAALGSIEYIWDLSHWFAAAIFVDGGRVYSSLSELSLDHLRMGYGIAFQVYSEAAFLFEASVASSIDGGLFINLTFNPTFDAQERWR